MEGLGLKTNFLKLVSNFANFGDFRA